jgi:hypothetical protein
METPLRRRRFDEILAVLDACFSGLLPRNPQRCLVRYNAAKHRLTVIKHGAHYRWKPRRTRGTWNVTEPPLIPSLILRIASLTEIDFQSLLHVFFHPWIAANSPFDLPTIFRFWPNATSSIPLKNAGLDCTAPLPLFNSLAHLVHLTATSPKIREILTRDGGLERLVRILRDFVANPPPPQDYGLFYGLLPPIPAGNVPPQPSPMSSHAFSPLHSHPALGHPVPFPPLAMHHPHHIHDSSHLQTNSFDPFEMTQGSSTAISRGPLQPDTRPFDRDAAQRFSLAFQCIVNVGVRGSHTGRGSEHFGGVANQQGLPIDHAPTRKEKRCSPREQS